MTDLEQLRIQRAAAAKRVSELDERIAESERCRFADRACAAFKKLGSNPNLQTLGIIEQALSHWGRYHGLDDLSESDVDDFVERLVATIEANTT